MASPAFRTFHILPNQVERTLSAVLREFLPDQSWSQVKALVRQRRVQINGNLCLDDERRLNSGDVLRVSAQSLAAPVTAETVRIVHVDEHVVVVEKPPGITTLRHSEEKDWSARRKNFQPTLEEFIDHKLSEGRPVSHPRSRGSSQPRRVRAVHRLDRDTSGLMVFARSPEAETNLIRQFKKHSVQRAYLAIALGQVAEQTISDYLIRDRGDGIRGGTSDASLPDAERAVTHVKPLEFLAGFTVVECRLETGRTHQIRIHLSERGHMLCGEKTYTQGLCVVYSEDTSGAPRQMLHAAVLGFIHPHTQLPLQFLSPLPMDMQRVLERLRKM